MSLKKNPQSGNHAVIADNELLKGAAVVIFILIATGWIAGNETSTPGTAASTDSQTSVEATTTSPIRSALPELIVTPAAIVQGDPVMITIPGLTATTDILSAIVGGTGDSDASNGSSLSFTMYQGMPTAFFGSNINHALGSTTITVVIGDGNNDGSADEAKNDRRLVATFLVWPRVRPLEPFPVPEQVGGNSPANQVGLADELAAENVTLAAVPLYAGGALWSKPFIYPLKASDQNANTLTITDPYGLDRDSGDVTILHMGADFRVPDNTPVYAVNDGIVRLARDFTEYGYTIIVDHGLGIESIYIHLSRIIVTPNETVRRGEIIGYSGETGYATGPHLHLSIKINRISIDPLKFFALFGLPPLPVSDKNGMN